MTQQEIQERNKQIATMLGYKLITPDMRKDPNKWNMSYWQKNYPEKQDVLCSEKYLSFHSDWNWLMEAVEFIEKLGKYSFAIDSHPLSGHTVLIHNATSYGITSLVIPDVTMPDKKEAVFIAVSDFAKLYNNKEL